MKPLRRAMAVVAMTLTIAGNVTGFAPVHAVALVPGAATVLTLAPAFFALPSNWLRGELFAAPNRKVTVPYLNLPTAGNVRGGAANLDHYLHSFGGPKIVVGHSEGAQVEDYWLRTYGPSSDIDPATVVFVLTGDLESKYNGCASVAGGGCVAAYGGKGFPADTRYTVKVVARQYDYYADCPDDLSNSVARQNRTASNLVGGQGQIWGVHLDYSNIGLNDPGNKVFVEGNATYILGSPATYWLPMVTLTVAGDSQRGIRDSQLRPLVEAAYHRPMGTLG